MIHLFYDPKILFSSSLALWHEDVPREIEDNAYAIDIHGGDKNCEAMHFVCYFMSHPDLSLLLLYLNIFSQIKDSLQHTKRQVKLYYHYFTMFITALCGSFLTKLPWPKNVERVSIYPCANFWLAKEDWCVMGFFQVESNCFYNWACRQSLFRLRLHADEAYGSIQWNTTH